MASPYLALIHNIGLLLAIALIFDVVALRPFGLPKVLQQVFMGIALGLIGIALMLTPWVFVPGIIFDTRSVLLGISGLFFGALPTSVAMLMTATLRLYQGGAAAWTGVSVILVTGLLGIAWRRLRRRPLVNITLGELYIFGVVSHICMLILMFTLPWEIALRVLADISLPVLVLYPLGTTMLGILLANRLRRQRAGDLLAESEERYRLLADHVSDVLWILNLETGQLEYVSPSVERLIGYTVEEVLAKPLHEVMTPASYLKVAEQMKEGIALVQHGGLSNHSFVNEVEQTCKDGSTVWTEVVTRYIWNKNAQLALLGISRNITARRQASEAAFALALERERLSMLTSFVQAASHEFRTPLFLIQADLYLIEKSTDASERKAKIDEIKRQLAGITRLIDVLTESTFLQSQTGADMEQLDLNLLVSDVVSELTDNSNVQGLTLNLVLDPKVQSVVGDVNRLRLAIKEILNNAVRFSPQSGQIDVSTTLHAEEIWAEIHDSGPGISPEVMPRIFEPFYRADSARTTPGLGLGLPIAQSIISAHSGHIEVENHPKGGSIFRIVLPVAQRTQPSTPSA